MHFFCIVRHDNFTFGLIDMCHNTTTRAYRNVVLTFGVILPSALITSRNNKFMFELQFFENSSCNIFN